jgi:hypothetical protein
MRSKLTLPKIASDASAAGARFVLVVDSTQCLQVPGVEALDAEGQPVDALPRGNR